MRRGRTNLACTTCRRRKSKCDGKRPTCSYCERSGINCEYQQVEQHTARSRHHETRAQLIARVQALEDRLEPDRSQSFSDRSPDNEDLRTVDDTRSPRTPHNPATSSHSLEDQLAYLEADDEVNVDLLATEPFEEGLETEIGYFGPSSNHRFFRNCSDIFSRVLTIAFERRHVSTQVPLSTVDNQTNDSYSGEHFRRVPDQYLLNMGIPPPLEAVKLIDLYFASCGPFTPFISRSLILSDLRDVQERRGGNIAVRRVLLQVIFSLAYASTDLARSSTLYRQGLLVLGAGKTHAASLSLLQALLLIAIYQQNHQLSVTSWTYHALAVRTAYQMGLQCPSTYRKYGQSERELRLHAWHHLIIQDRILCMCLGRPCLVPAFYVRNSKQQQSEKAMPENLAAQVRDTPCQMYHRQLLSLHTIISQILSQMYHDNIDDDTLDDARTLISVRLPLLWQLEEWLTTTSNNCTVFTAGELEATRHVGESDRFRLVLSIHYHRAVLLLNGPVLLVLLSDICGVASRQHSASLFEQVRLTLQSEFDALCTLHRITSLALKDTAKCLDRNAMWWLCNYTAFTIVLHLFAILLFCYHKPNILAVSGIAVDEVRSMLTDALRNMAVVQRTSVMTRKAHRCLSGFIQIFDSIYSSSWTDAFESADFEQTSTFAAEAMLDPSQFVRQTANDFLGLCGIDDLLRDGTYFGLDSYT